MHLGDIEKITVLGIGVMGPDISMGFAMAGYKVTGVDIKQTAVDAAYAKLAANLEQMLAGQMISPEEAAQIKSRISFTLEWESSVSQADFITEAVPEEMETKIEVYERCGRLCDPKVVVASNTSSMDINLIASKMKHPERAISTHWTIPAHLSPMVEIIRGDKTSQDTEELAFALLRKVGKEPVSCQNKPGFIHNYVQFSMVKAALNLVEAGVASAADVDTVIKNGFGLRLSSVGPVEFVDMCGLDTILNIQKYMFAKTGDSVFRPSKSIEEKVAKGDLGIKSGKGFFDYQQDNSTDFWERTNRNIIRILQAVRGEKSVSS